MDYNIEEQLVSIVGKENFLMDEPMEKHTTFRIGGPADYFVTPKNGKELQEVIRFCKKERVDYYIIGNGSNLLVSDAGYRGVMIQISKHFSQFSIKETREGKGYAVAGAGILLSKLSVEIARHGFTGFEFAAGIPGTLGGAVTMNGGAYGGEIKDFIVSAKVIDENGDILELSRDQLNLGYRTSIIQKMSYLVTETSFLFGPGEREDILNKMEDLNRRRKEKQPLEFPSAGSTFKRPEGFFAGELIMKAGLKGYRIGDIMISEKHCGFVINVGKGTGLQAKQLISDVSRIVFEKFGIYLEPEVKMIGYE